MTNLEKAILATLSYYDIFDYPLTGFEIWKYCMRANGHEMQNFGAGDLFTALDGSGALRERISQKYGFYFLRGRDEIVEKRLWRRKLADRKWKKAIKIFRILSAVPFVRAIFVSGSLAMENSKNDSDIDVIIVAKYGRIWTVRTFMTMLTFILGVRRHGDKTKDRICLNHYITDKSLRISFESLYNAQSYAHLVNVYGEDGRIFKEFQEENRWIGKYILNYGFSELESVRTVRKNRTALFMSKFFGSILSGKPGDWMEKFLSGIESGRIRKDPLCGKAGGRITVDDTQLEFHPDSHEYSVIPQFNRRMEEMGFSEFANQQDSGLNR